MPLCLCACVPGGSVPFLFVWGLCVGGLGVWLAVVGCGCALLCLVPGGGFPDMEGFSVNVVLLCLVYAFYWQVSECPLFTKTSHGRVA